MHSHNKLSSLVFFVFTLLVCLPIFAQTADTLLMNGSVYSLNWGEPNLDGKPASDAPFHKNIWSPDATALAIKNGEILFVGADRGAEKYRGSATKIIDLAGATVIPGLVDSHVHLAEYGELLRLVNLNEVGSPAAAIEMLQKQSGSLKKGEWVIGQGWDEGAWANNYPNRKMLDEAFPDNPVYLRSLHGFGVWANTQALKLARIDRETSAPVGGVIVRDSQGEPTGILLNRATTLIEHAVPKPNIEKLAEYIHGASTQMLRDGFVAAHDAGSTSAHIAAMQYLQATDKLPIRLYAMLSARSKELSAQWQARGPSTDPRGFLDIRSVKAYYDGALGSRGARLLADYTDRPGHRGAGGDGYGFDAEVVDGLISAGFQVGIHAIGDAGNREVLDYFSAAEKRYPESKNLRHRVEHAQIIDAADFSRFRELQLIASMEPAHAVEDKTWAEDRLGPDRIKRAYAWRTLRKAGVPLTFNSDLPGSDHSIFYGLHAAITRRDKQSMPPQGWHPEQNVSIEEAIRAYTNWAAYSAFRESQTGILKKGYWADITVLDIDPFKLATTEPSKILGGKVVMTVVNGEIKYQASAD